MDLSKKLWLFSWLKLNNKFVKKTLYEVIVVIKQKNNDQLSI